MLPRNRLWLVWVLLPAAFILGMFSLSFSRYWGSVLEVVYASDCPEPEGGCGTGYYWDYMNCICTPESSCTEPDGGCGMDYYWDSASCACIYSGGCTEPGGGCGMDYYWDFNSCSCVYVPPTPTSCTEPSGGCGMDYYWDSASCACIYSGGCTEPGGGCGVDYYWDSYACSCVYSPAVTDCVTPEGGCGVDYYWDQHSCSCYYYGIPTTCQEPYGGCGTGYYWDTYTCSCVYYAIPTSYCTEPSGGCGTSYYWDSGACSCVYYDNTTSCQQPSGGCGDNYYWDYSSCSCVYYGMTSSSCYEPSGGCPENYYWNSGSCSCEYSTSYCQEPFGGCWEGYYWDNYSCYCKPLYEICEPPSDGCGTQYYWDQYSCSCRSTCYEPIGGCGVGFYWDFGMCMCRQYDMCNPPSEGCGADYYWDSYFCACKPYQIYTDTVCQPPAVGCGEDSYWDSYSCNCKIYPTYYICEEPYGGCGYGWYWDTNSCVCVSDSDSQIYYTNDDYTLTNDEVFDRLAYEPPDRISCIKSVLTPTEFERLRYLIPVTDWEQEEIHKLGERVRSCWENVYGDYNEGVSYSPTENESCLIDALGLAAYKEIVEGKREPTYEEHLKFERCYGDVGGDPVNYVTSDQSIPKSTDNCLQKVLGSDLYNKVKNGSTDVPHDLRKKVDRCFGIDPQPFEEGRSYKLPEKIKQCLRDSVGEDRFGEINSGRSEPSASEKAKADSCFDQLNKDQVNFLPPPPERVPFLDYGRGVIDFSNISQTKKKIGKGEMGDKVVFSGVGIPGSVVNIYIFSDPIVVTTKVDENGEWIYELDQPLKDEKHIAYATSKDTSGNIVRSSVFDFQVIAAEEDLAKVLLDESKSSIQSRFLTYAFFIMGVAVVVFMGGFGYVQFRKIKTLDLPKKGDLGGSDGNSERDTGSGTVN